MDRHELTERALPFLLRRLHDAGISATPHTDEHTGSGLRVKMCVWLGVSRGLDLAFLNAD